MKFGLLYNFCTPEGRRDEASRVYAETMDQIALADELGFDDVWLSEHHFAENDYLPSPLVVAGAAAARTKRVTIGTGIAVLPFYNPVRLAEDCAVVDNLSGGRFRLGVGLGYRDDEYRGFGVTRADRVGMFEEALEILAGCWTEENFTYRGQHFSVDRIFCGPRPVQERIPIWVGASVDSAISRAARLGDGWFAFGIDSRSRSVYLDALQAAGKSTGSPAIAALPLGWVIASEDPERDWSVLRPHALTELRPLTRWLTAAGMMELGGIPQTEDDAERSGMFTVATPEDIVEKIKAVHAAAPFERFITPAAVRGAPIEIGNRSLELFRDRVIPALEGLDSSAS